MQQIVAILPVKGAELVGPLPAELQNVITYAAGISVRALHPAAEAFIAFTRTQASKRLMLSQRDPKQSPMGYMGSPGIGRNACAIALLCPYRLDLRR